MGEIEKAHRSDVDFENSKNLVEDGSLDSIDIFETVEMIEVRMAIKLDGMDIDLDNFVTVDKMWKLI